MSAVVNHHKPLAGRRLYFVGIAGSGMSAYANVARALGAEVRGWDAHETIFSETLDGIEVDLGGEPRPPDGFEVIVSTAHRDRIAGTPRAVFLAELVAARPSIVVTGAHGKTTTAAMIAHALRETGTIRRGSSAGSCLSSAATPVPARVARRRGGRVRPLRLRAPAAGRRGHERRARPLRNLRLEGGARRGDRRVARRCSRRRPRPGARAGVVRPADPRGAQPPQRGRRHRGARENRRRPHGGGGRSRGFRGRRPALPARRRGWRGDGVRRLRPQPDRDPRGARDRARSRRTAASWPSTSRTSSSGRDTSTGSSATRWLSQTSRSSRTSWGGAMRHARTSPHGWSSTPSRIPSAVSGRRRSTTPPVWHSRSSGPATWSSRSGSASPGAPRGRSPTVFPPRRRARGHGDRAGVRSRA